MIVADSQGSMNHVGDHGKITDCQRHFCGLFICVGLVYDVTASDIPLSTHTQTKIALLLPPWTPIVKSTQHIIGV